MPGLLGTVIFVLSEYQTERQRLKTENMQRAHVLGQAIDNHLYRAQALALSFSGASEILNGDVDTFMRRATRAIAASGLGSHVLVHRIERGRIVRLDQQGGRIPVQAADAEATAEVLENGAEVISNLVVDPGSGRTFVDVHVPVMLDGKAAYAVGIAIPTSQLATVLAEYSLPAGWLSSIVDRKGIIVARSQSSWLIGQAAKGDLLDAVKAHASGTLDGTSSEGIASFAAFYRSPRTGYTALIGVPQSQLVGPLKTRLAYLSATVGILIVLGLVLAQYMSKLISTSVHALIEPAMAMGRGIRLPVARVHLLEAMEVAAAFERTADLLGQRDAILSAQQEELQRFQFFSENANEILVLLDEKGNIRYANRMASERLGHSNAELLGMVLFQIDPLATPALLESVFAQCRSAQVPPFERVYRCKDGTEFPVEITATVLQHRGEWLMHVAVRDISERRQADGAIRWAASHDALTGLANRVLALEFLGQALAGASGALLYIDLNRFKPINDIHGHAFGDRVLIEIAQRMGARIHQGDLLARVGGDEFIAVLIDRGASTHWVTQAAQALAHAVSAPFAVGNIEVKLSASIGVSRFPEHGNSADVLIHTADLAMLQAKQEGSDSVVFYSPDMAERAQFFTNMERRLQQALDAERFTLHYQPIVNLATGKADGVEALVRLADGIESALGPATFIPVAEMCGLIAPLGKWVAREACRQQRAWGDAGVRLNVSVNVSALQFGRADFVQQIHQLLDVSGIDPAWLVIELTETAVMENISEAVRVLNDIRALGVRVALDDFGTGYSSMSILSSLPVDKLKIDQSFVRNIETDHASRAIIDAVIALAKSLDIELVAEGIETEAAMRYLRERGCQLGQGYYFSPPLAPRALIDWLANAAPFHDRTSSHAKAEHTPEPDVQSTYRVRATHASMPPQSGYSGPS